MTATVGSPVTYTSTASFGGKKFPGIIIGFSGTLATLKVWGEFGERTVYGVPEDPSGSIPGSWAEAASGTVGPAGPPGPQGDPGPAGPQGIEGPVGPAGPAGAAGQATVIVGSFGASKTPADLPPNGLIPADWDAPGAPSVPVQLQQGQSLIFTPDGHLWQFVGVSVNAAGWLDVGLIQGPPGPQGPQGAQGPTGAQGPQGPEGPAGTPVEIYTGRVSMEGNAIVLPSGWTARKMGTGWYYIDAPFGSIDFNLCGWSGSIMGNWDAYIGVSNSASNTLSVVTKNVLDKTAMDASFTFIVMKNP